MKSDSYFLIKPKPYSGESLTSYLQRICEVNMLSPHALWRSLSPQNKHYPQTQISTIIDVTPDAVMKTDNLLEMVNFYIQLDNHTFLPVLKKFYGLDLSGKNISSQRFISGQLLSYTRFCPLCLEDKSFYKTIWQVSELNICLTHEVYLADQCPICKKKIPKLAPYSITGLCPSCSSILSQTQTEKANITKLYERMYEDWIFLLDPAKSLLSNMFGLDFKQMLALKALFLTSKNISEFNYTTTDNSILSTSTIRSLLQIARKTSSTDRYVHISTIFEVIRKRDMTLKEFFQIDIPQSFITSIINRNPTKLEQYACMAPWCSSHGTPGSLQRTATSKKVLKDSTKLNYYLYCKKCGMKYAINATTKELIERGYFIHLAWGKVRDLLSQNKSIGQIARELNISKDQTLRCVIFLVANKVIPCVDYKMGIPKQSDDSIVKQFKHLIQAGTSSKEIKKILNLSYTEFLYYWFLPEIMLQYVETSNIPNMKYVKLNLLETLQNILEELIKGEEPIKVQKVSAKMNVCPETLRLHGLLPIITEAKDRQKEVNLEKEKMRLIYFVDNFIEIQEQNKKKIRSEDLYNKLGKKRNVLVRLYPDITSYITKKMKSTNWLMENFTTLLAVNIMIYLFK